MIDPALLRGGRLGDKIFMDFPGARDIKEILTNICSEYSSNIDDFIEDILSVLKGSSPADLVALIKTAYEIACSEVHDIEWSMESLKKQKNEIRKYEINDQMLEAR